MRNIHIIKDDVGGKIVVGGEEKYFTNEELRELYNTLGELWINQVPQRTQMHLFVENICAWIEDNVWDYVNTEQSGELVILNNFRCSEMLEGLRKYIYENGYNGWDSNVLQGCETAVQKTVNDICEYLYDQLYTRNNGAEHYVASKEKITQTEFVDKLREYIEGVQ